MCMFIIHVNCILCASPALLSALLAAPSLSERREETGSTTYDQKQSGKYNIHLNIKDVAIIALDSGNTDSGGDGDFGEDYYVDYDLSDFTVKPVFGLVDSATSEKPSSTTAPPALIHFKPDSDLNFYHQNNATDKSTTKEPIIKDPIANKTQSVVILNEEPPPIIPLIHLADSSPSGVVLTTPGTNELQAMADKSHVNDTKQSYKPNEIPVHIVIEPTRSTMQSGHRQGINSEWRLLNHIRSTPSNIRKITPPRFENVDQFQLTSLETNRRHTLRTRNCAVDRFGRCQSSPRFKSPAM